MEERIFSEVLERFVSIAGLISTTMTAHEFDGEASVLIGVFLNPEILEQVQCSLVCVMLGMICEKTVADESVGPEARDTFNNLPAPFIYRLQSGLSLTF